jgi:hypothetical protein
MQILDTGSSQRDGRLRITFGDSQYAGKQAVFSLESEVRVDDSSPVHDDRILYEEEFVIESGKLSHEVIIPAEHLDRYTYKGNKISILMHCKLSVDDSLLFDTKLTESFELPLGTKPRVDNDAGSIIDPKDIFSFFANLKAIPAHNQATALALVVVGGIVVIVNAIIGIHDQFVPDAMTWFYSHPKSSDDAGPLEMSLTGSGVVGVGIWYALRKQLQKYMKFHLNRNLPKNLRPDIEYPVGKFFYGKSRVPLRDVTLRIVASNMECGQYQRRQGSTTRTVSFREPVRGVVLFEKTARQIPARTSISRYFEDEVFRFDEMFHVLYPPNMISDTHGLDVHWEIQLLHPEYVDHELQGPGGKFRFEDFLGDGRPAAEVEDKPAQKDELTFEL